MPSIVTTPELDPPRRYLWDVESKLRELNEKALRERVLPELLYRLGFVEVRSRHGPREEGKDLLAWHVSRIGSHDWVGFVVKAGDLNAQVASSSGIRAALHQAEQVLDHEVIDPITSALSVVRECWVVTNGEIPGHAVDEVASTLRRHHLEKAVRWIDVTTLTRLLNKHVEPERLAELLGLPASAASGLDAEEKAVPTEGESHG